MSERLAQRSFRAAAPNVERPDAVMYCLTALQKFDRMPIAEIQKIAFEIAILGTRGLSVNDPSKTYFLNSLPGEFTALQLVCLMYVGFKKFAPEQDVGFDLSQEYQRALQLYRPPEVSE